MDANCILLLCILVCLLLSYFNTVWKLSSVQSFSFSSMLHSLFVPCRVKGHRGCQSLSQLEYNGLEGLPVYRRAPWKQLHSTIYLIKTQLRKPLKLLHIFRISLMNEINICFWKPSDKLKITYVCDQLKIRIKSMSPGIKEPKHAKLFCPKQEKILCYYFADFQAVRIESVKNKPFC